MIVTMLMWGAVYFVLWWLCLFIVLPFGARSQTDAGEMTQGTDPGAPALFRFWPKLLATSLLAGVLLALFMWAITNPMLQAYWS